MVAMQQALRRDVLQWLVSLNLSFPIKNIKRDFSNGFLVAEILSRYYPHDVHMHSFDYGTKSAKKKDNWEQLKKIFQKEGFPFFQDEIDSIINCGPNDGIAPLLERLYGFITNKRYKPMCADDVHELWTGASSTSLILVDGGVLNLSNDAQRLSTAEHVPSYLGVDFTNVNVNMGELQKDDQTAVLDAEMVLASDEAPPSSGQEIGKAAGECCIRKHIANAVEKARQKDKKSKEKDDTKSHVTNNIVEMDASLAFRSPNRQREFRCYTLKDYKQQYIGRYIALGKLGPETTESLLSQRERLEKMKAFGRIARDNNVAQTAGGQKPKEKHQSCREKAMEFASKLPKPKKKKPQKENIQQGVQNCDWPITELQRLELKHQKDRQEVEAIRRELEIFIR